MNKVAPWIILISLFLPSGAGARQQLTRKETTCNVRYNNLGVVAGNVPCKAWFSPSGNLYRAKFFYPRTGAWYDWSTTQKRVESDKRWAECIRYTQPEGNQWQVCTVPSPQQLGL